MMRNRPENDRGASPGQSVFLPQHSYAVGRFLIAVGHPGQHIGRLLIGDTGRQTATTFRLHIQSGGVLAGVGRIGDAKVRFDGGVTGQGKDP